MLSIVFFARIREELDCANLTVEWRDGLDLDTLQEQLGAQYGEKWIEVLGEDNIIRAVNQEVVSHNCVLNEGDEIAFFPPVTGG